ncbi:MAG: type II secretion system F family protein [Bradymonadales bacterium]|nr:MAG: type II secretion system F family protein [Bradymonadales bacterium]
MKPMGGLDVFAQSLYLLIGLAAVGFFSFQLVKLIMPDQELLAAQARLGVESANRNYRHWSLRLLAPFFRSMLPRIQQFKIPLYRQKKKKLFVVAGVDDQFNPDEFIGLKFCASVSALLIIYIFFLNAGWVFDLSWVGLSLVLGFFLPDYVVWELKRKRQRAIIRELPNVMDLLTLSVEAGMDFMAAISRVIEFSKPGPLREELSVVLKEIQVGSTRAEALRSMADRVELSQISSFASILIQADEMGSSIGPVLRAQSDLLRNDRFQRAEREGAKAAQKILIPLILCILPAVFIVIMGPVICDVYYNQPWLREFFGG